MALEIGFSQDGNLRLQGGFEDLSTGQLLMWLAREKQTGELQLNTGNFQQSIYFAQGFPVGTRGGPPENYLGWLMMERGYIDNPTYLKSLELMTTQHKLQGQVLLETGAIEPDQLKATLVIQLQRKLIRLFLEERANFVFVGQPNPAIRDIEPGLLDPLAMITHGIRQAFDAGRLRTYLSPLNGKAIRILPESQRPFPYKRLLFEVDEMASLALLEPWTTIAQFVQSGYLDEFPALVILAILFTTDQFEQGDISNASKTPSRHKPTPPPATQPPPATDENPFLSANAGDTPFELDAADDPLDFGAAAAQSAPQEEAFVDPLADLLGGGADSAPSDYNASDFLSASPEGDLGFDDDQGAISMGPPASSSNQGAISMGPPASSSNQGAISMGPPASSSNQGAISMGPPDSSSNQGAISMGPPASSSNQGAISMGPPASSDNQGAISMGPPASSSSQGATSKQLPRRRQHSQDELNSPEMQEKYKELEDNINNLYPKLEELTHYEILEIENTATEDEIRTAYYKLSRSYHPDSVSGTPLESEREKLDKIFARVSEAYSTLSKDEKREEYDHSLDPEIARLKEQAANAAQAEIFFTKATVFLKKSDYEKALEQLKWACDLMPEEGDYLATYAWALYNAGDRHEIVIKEVEEYFAKAERYGATPEKFHYYRGVYMRDKGELKKAIKDFKAVLEKSPRNTDAKRELRYAKIKWQKQIEEKAAKKKKAGGLFGRGKK